MSIIFKDFTFRYDAQSKSTLKNINLQIKKGEKVLIAGPSGSGKSTLGHCINGLIPFSYSGEYKGELLISGKKGMESSIHELSESVGTILQDQDGQFIGLSVGEDVAFFYENHNKTVPEMQEGVKKALESVDMYKFHDETPHNLSGGQKQSVSLAGIIATETDILLFDEPLANLDPYSSHNALRLINEVHESTEKTVIVIEHRIEEVLAYDYDRIIIMNGGVVIAEGHPNEILATEILSKHGLREPLYIEALKKMGADIKPTDALADIKNVEKFSSIVKSWFADSIEPQKIKREDLLKVKNINFRYYEDAPQILNDVTLSLKKGEVLAILGNNGAGKSTLLKVITGLVKPQEGDVLLDDKSITNWTIKRRADQIGYVMQNPNHMITKNLIFDEIAFGLRNKGIAEDKVVEMVHHTMEICGLGPFKKWPISALSFGQKKRVTIASILVLKPSIIILDEPTAGQDYRNYKEFMTFLEELKKEHVSIVIITHDMHLAMEYADRAVVLSGGRVIDEDEVAKVLSKSNIMEQANLRGTTLNRLCTTCGISDVSSFISRYTFFAKGVFDV